MVRCIEGKGKKRGGKNDKGSSEGKGYEVREKEGGQRNEAEEKEKVMRGSEVERGRKGKKRERERVVEREMKRRRNIYGREE